MEFRRLFLLLAFASFCIYILRRPTVECDPNIRLQTSHGQAVVSDSSHKSPTSTASASAAAASSTPTSTATSTSTSTATASASSSAAPAVGGRVSVRDIGFLIITGAAHHADRVRWIKQTYFQWLPADVIQKQVAFMSDAEDSSIPTVFSPDSCCGHVPSQRKWRNGLIHMRKTMPAHVKWLWVLDDDAFAIVPNMLHFLEDKDPAKRVYYGQRCPDFNGFRAMCGGASWVASRTVTDSLAEKLEGLPWPLHGEDMSDRILSKVMEQDMGIPMIESVEFGSQPPMFYLYESPGLRDKPDGFGRAVSFHYINEQNFKLLFNLMAAAFGKANLKR